MDRDKLKWLFFDMGSTLIDESVAIEHRIREVIEGTDITYEQFLEKKVFFAKQNKPADLTTLEYFGLKKTPWHKEDERLFPETVECLECLHKYYKIGIIANQSPGSEERLERFGIRKYIDIVVASAEEGVAKPDKRIFEIALERADCKRSEAAMIGDRLDNDIVPANELGMYTIWMKQGNWSHATPKKRLEYPDWTIRSLEELKELVKEEKF
ncbi:MAG: HAD family hydrolase [Lachnospiraceae bacterium]|nr:HAD family hydrolase [Lachnospiraceae bacterium]